MKCKHCGSNLIMDAAYCPYCGNENPYFKQHREEMAEYQEEYFETKEEVLESTEKFKHITIKTTVAAILIVLNLLVFLGLMNMYNITKWMNSLYVDSHISEIAEQMETLELEEDYAGMNLLYEEYGLYYFDEFDEYREIYYCASAYSYTYENLVNWDDKMSYVSTQDDLEEYIKILEENIEYLAKQGIQDEYDNPDCFSELHVYSMNKMKENILVLVQQHFDLDQETIDSFFELSSYQRESLLQEGVIYNVE